MESKNYQQRENSSDDEKRVRQIPKQTLLRLASDSRTKPEIKSTTAKPVEETHFEEFFQQIIQYIHTTITTYKFTIYINLSQN